MNLTIKRSPQVLVDVIDQPYYTAGSSSLNASDKFLKAVETAYKQLSGMPGMGSPRDYGSQYSGLQIWHVPKSPKYPIFYQATDTELIIRRMLHEAQDIAQIFSKVFGPLKTVRRK